MAAFPGFSSSYWTPGRSEADQRYVLEDVPVTIQLSIAHIIYSEWNAQLVGKGRDAEKLKHSGIMNVGVKRVDNPTLLRAYEGKTLEIARRRGLCPPITNIPEPLASFNKGQRLPAVNEYYLFHGTDPDAAVNIAKIGFKIRKADPQSMLGKGIYFSDSFMKADQYADVARLNRPPCISHGERCSCGPQQRYDSITSTGLLFREFAVYDEMQCYPEYIITYMRKGNQVPQLQDE